MHPSNSSSSIECQGNWKGLLWNKTSWTWWCQVRRYVFLDSVVMSRISITAPHPSRRSCLHSSRLRSSQSCLGQSKHHLVPFSTDCYFIRCQLFAPCAHWFYLKRGTLRSQPRQGNYLGHEEGQGYWDWINWASSRRCADEVKAEEMVPSCLEHRECTFFLSPYIWIPPAFSSFDRWKGRLKWRCFSLTTWNEESPQEHSMRLSFPPKVRQRLVSRIHPHLRTYFILFVSGTLWVLNDTV